METYSLPPDLPYLRLRVEMVPAALLTNRGQGRSGPRGQVRPSTSGPRGRERIDRRAMITPRLRRALGKALIDLHCPHRVPRCQKSDGPRREASDLCPLAASCPYGVLFAASRSARPPFSLHLEPGRPGEAELLELTLYGSAWHLHPWLLAALARALAAGIGRHRTRWAITRVEHLGPEGSRRLPRATNGGPPSVAAPDVLPWSRTLQASEPVAIELVSPCRFLQDGQLLFGDRSVPFAVLFGRILDRFSGLYGEVLTSRQRADLETAATAVPLLADHTTWRDVHDYSARSRSLLKMGGKVGTLIYGPEAAPFLPWLALGEILHVGKNPTAGCGRIRVSGNVRERLAS